MENKIKVVQTKAIQTILDQDGRLNHYRLTLPVPEEFANTVESKFIVYGRNKVRYFTFKHSDFDKVKEVMLQAQIKINGIKIKNLQERHVRLTHEFAMLK